MCLYVVCYRLFPNQPVGNIRGYFPCRSYSPASVHRSSAVHLSSYNCHVCPPCRPSVCRTIFACSFSTLFFNFNACTCSRVFANHCCRASGACSFLGVCTAFWRGHQCVLTPCISASLHTLTRCVLSFQLTVTCLQKSRRS